jgi:YVTN family beta-propeller protein
MRAANCFLCRFLCRFLCSAAVLLPSLTSALASDPIHLPTGVDITPDVVPHSVILPLNPGDAKRPNYRLGTPVTTALSPDGSRLLVLTSGWNQDTKDSKAKLPEYVLIYDAAVFPPKQVQAVPVPNSFCGLAWNPNGQEFYVSGGVDDTVYSFAKAANGRFAQSMALKLDHARGLGLLSNSTGEFLASAPKPMAAGIAVNQAGTVAVVANLYNDSISLIDLKTRRKSAELDLRPGVADPAKTGVPGGSYPYWVAIQGDDTAFVSSPRDREIVVVGLGGQPKVTGRIPVQGQPNRVLLNRAQDRLYVALDNADSVAIVDAKANRVLSTIRVTAPAELLPSENVPRGANPNSVALSPDEKTLYVTNGGTNSVAVVSLESTAHVIGLIPTGWYPESVTVSKDGKNLYVVNAKSMPGLNVGNCRADVQAPGIPDCPRTGAYILAQQLGSLTAMAVPAAADLVSLTQQASKNNHFDVVRTLSANPVMSELRRRIKHVIYIVKENRTYDQVLGDLDRGNGDPSLAEFPEPLTPNHHRLAKNFVTLDNFYDSGEVSGVGWNWSVAARTTDYTEKSVIPNYAGRGFTYDWEGQNRNVNVGIGSVPDRVNQQPLLAVGGAKPDLNLLPGPADVAAPDSHKGDIGEGYIWDEALRAGLTVRNYGFYCDLSRYDNPEKNPVYAKISKTPFADKLQQAFPVNHTLIPHTDLYFRSFDQRSADYYDVKEWEREFDGYVQNRNLPNLTLMRISHDHFGSFKDALYGINTPAKQMADNDYALGLIAQKVGASIYKDDTLIFVIEDDAQDGPDHVDAHRSIAYVVGPYVKQGAVISERYNTVSMIRTMEEILGVAPSSLMAAAVAPMDEVFDFSPALSAASWKYTAIVPEILRGTDLPVPAATAQNSLPASPRVLAFARDQHDAKYWQKKIGDMDYEEEDKLDTPRFNTELWKGLMGNQKYPVIRPGTDLRQNRAALLKQYGIE